MNDLARPENEAPRVRTLLLTDLVDSTTLVERLGDVAAADLFRAHDHLVLELQQRWRGRLIDRSDGLLLLFDRPVDGLGFALDYERGLRTLGERDDVRASKVPLLARAGLHVGEVLTWRNSPAAVDAGAKSMEVEGLAKPLTARLMMLARPGQVLLSATAEPLARRAARELGERSETLIWKSHGRWVFKGVPEPQEVFEVGEPGLAPLRMPAHGAKAWRDIPLWRRPAALAAELLLVVGLGTGAWFITRPQPAIAFGERDWVVVGDLRNLTGQTVLDASLEQAFRISLEQSSYVNVLSDLKVRETLGRMQREPGTAVDRMVGSEVALRGGARALLLPTIAEVGGRLRFSTEVVDPRTQTTVYSLHADGRGLESALSSVDEVAGELRETLGEAMKGVQQGTVSLPNVATPSLDALKAYALARDEIDTRRDLPTAIGLYRRALELDPGFALAHAGIGQAHAGVGEVEPALQAWQRALALKGRLSPQERQRVELLIQQYRFDAPYFQRAQEYLKLYPDDAEVIGRLGTAYWHQRNDFARAATYYRGALRPEFPRHGVVSYGLGITLLGQDRIEDAQAAFRRARAFGFTGAGALHARSFDVGRQHAEADRVYRQSGSGRQGWRGEEGVLTAVDRGQWAQAPRHAREMASDAAARDALERLRTRMLALSLEVLMEPAAAPARLRAMLKVIDAQGAAADALGAGASIESRLVVGLLASEVGDAALVDHVLRQVAGNRALPAMPTIGQLHQVVLAARERLAGNPAQAAARLRALARGDDALVAVHVGLLRAARAAGDGRTALEQARWLSARRGRVFAESTTNDLLRVLNVAASNEALLEQAELLAGAGDAAGAARALDGFLAAWPEEALPGGYRRRVAAVRDGPKA